MSGDLKANDRIGAVDATNRAGPGQPNPPGRDRWLAVLWPVAVLFHLLGNSGHLQVMDGIGMLQFGLAAAAVVAVVLPRPGSTLLVSVLYLVVLWWKLPVVGNHEILLGLMALAITISVPLAHRSATWWPVVAAPAFRLIYLIGYGFIALSKLNTGFFDTTTSCAVIFGDAMLGPLGPGGGGFGMPGWFVIVATAVIELVIPVLLITRRYRFKGLVLGLGFHFVLSLDPGSHVFDFSATLLPLFCLFGSPGLRAGLDRLADRLWRRPMSEPALVLAVIAGLHGFVLITRSRGGMALPLWTVGFPLWLVVGGGVLGLAVRSLRVEPTPGDRGLARFRPTPVLMLVVMLTTANGIAPYLQVRSAAAFNMYSNLVVADGMSNSIVVPALRSAGATPSTVAILAAAPGSDLGYYIENELRLPTENLDRHLRRNPDENPLIDWPNGKAAKARGLGFGATDDGFSAAGQRLLRYKLGFRRAVDGTGRHRCLRAWGPLG